jgi:hypothetical protein
VRRRRGLVHLLRASHGRSRQAVTAELLLTSAVVVVLSIAGDAHGGATKARKRSALGGRPGRLAKLVS